MNSTPLKSSNQEKYLGLTISNKLLIVCTPLPFLLGVLELSTKFLKMGGLDKTLIFRGCWWEKRVCDLFEGGVGLQSLHKK